MLRLPSYHFNSMDTFLFLFWFLTPILFSCTTSSTVSSLSFLRYALVVWFFSKFSRIFLNICLFSFILFLFSFCTSLVYLCLCLAVHLSLPSLVLPFFPKVSHSFLKLYLFLLFTSSRFFTEVSRTFLNLCLSLSFISSGFSFFW